MAGIFRRRRGFLVKLVLVVPVLYIISLFVFSKRSFPSSDTDLSKGDEVKAQPRAAETKAPAVMEVPKNVVDPQLDFRRQDNAVKDVVEHVATMKQERSVEERKQEVVNKPEPDHDPNGPGTSILIFFYSLYWQQII